MIEILVVLAALFVGLVIATLTWFVAGAVQAWWRWRSARSAR